MKRVSRGIDGIEVTFDEEHLVANAGLLLVSILATALAPRNWPTQPFAWWAESVVRSRGARC